MTTRVKSLIIILTAISFLSLFLLPLSSAIDFSFSSPAEVIIDEAFSVSITADTNDTYDVKVYVEDPNSTPKTISEIYDGSDWQNSYYYVNEVFPLQTSFDVRVKKVGSWDICVRLRKSSTGTTTSPSCKPITVIEQEQQDDQDQNQTDQNQTQDDQQNQTQDDNTSPDDSQDDEEDDSQDQQDQTDQSTQSTSNNNQQTTSSFSNNDEKIVLNSGSAQSQGSSKEFTTLEGNIRLTAVYVFSAMCVFIIILLALRKL